MEKKYLIAFISLLVFFAVVFSLTQLTDTKSNIKDASNNFEYHIIYYDYNNSIDNTSNNEVDSEEEYDDYYDTPFEDEEDIEASINEEIYLPINIYKKGNTIYVTKEYKQECSEEPCENKTTDYNLNFSDEGKEIISTFITTKFTDNNENVVTLYKNDLTDMEQKIISSIINNDESYLQ